jgi:2,3-diketo-5-methylthio-1-phosphopentane phosphatase
VRHWNILCDFDGTISTEDVIDGLLERYGQEGWRALEADWVAGQIGSRECMQGQVALLDLAGDELDAHLDTLAVDPDFPAFVAEARRQGHQVSVVSDGLDYAIRRLLARHGLGDLPVAANRLSPGDVPRRWRLDSPFSADDCGSGTCKCARIQGARAAPAGPVLLVGDGRSDFCASGAADLVFAKGRLARYCAEQQLRHRPIAGFGDALALLPDLDSLLVSA